jgi:uncharacterized protein YdaU (DUF1376 family)
MSDRSLGYYKWYWQDFRANRKVQRMTYIQRGLYRELLDECWAEGSIPDDIEQLADICGCPVDVMADAWHVLNKCFAKDGTTWRNEKLETMRTERDQIRVKKSEAGRLGGLAKSLKTDYIKADGKQMPSTCHIEEKRREEKSKEKKKTTTTPDGVSVEVWSDFIVLRNKLRAPVTNTVVSGIAREAAKAGISLDDALRICCERGWRGFKAEWLANKTPMQSAHQASTLAAARSIFGDERSLTNERIIDITPRKALT